MGSTERHHLEQSHGPGTKAGHEQRTPRKEQSLSLGPEDPTGRAFHHYFFFFFFACFLYFLKKLL